jgi:hypothetical protein
MILPGEAQQQLLLEVVVAGTEVHFLEAVVVVAAVVAENAEKAADRLGTDAAVAADGRTSVAVVDSVAAGESEESEESEEFEVAEVAEEAEVAVLERSLERSEPRSAASLVESPFKRNIVV